MYMNKLSEKPLTKKQQQLLIKTPEDTLKVIFPNYKRDFLRREKRRLLSQRPIEEKIIEDFEYRDARKEASESKRKIDFLIEENAKKDKLLEAQTKLKSKLDYFKILPHKSKHNNEATAVCLLSDWHIDEVVEDSSINYLNKFNYTIAEERVTKTFQTIKRFLDIFQRDIEVKTLCFSVIRE